MLALLDVNVLVALVWPGHQAFARVHRWFGRHATAGFATCPLTQAGFVRIVSNPAFSPRAVTPREAVAALATTVKHPGHQFWKDELPLEQAVRPFEQRLVGHQQVTDAYLLGLAVHHRGKLVTLDRATLALLPDSSFRSSIELLEA
jgi:uncharacterized protein